MFRRVVQMICLIRNGNLTIDDEYRMREELKKRTKETHFIRTCPQIT